MLNEYDKKWVNKTGDLVKFSLGLPDNVLIASKNDYLKLVKEFCGCKLDISEFCKKYDIKSESEFNDLLLFSQEKYLSDDNYYSKKMVEQILNGLTFEEYFKKLYKPAITLNSLINGLNQNDLYYILNLFVNYLKLNKEILPLNKIMNFLDCRYLKNISSHLVKSICNINDVKVRNNLIKEYKESINFECYHDKFIRHISYIDIIINGIRYSITDNILDQAILFIQANEIYLCQYTVLSVAKRILLGDIIVSKEILKREIMPEKKLIIIDKYIQLQKEKAKEEKQKKLKRNK